MIPILAVLLAGTSTFAANPQRVQTAEGPGKSVVQEKGRLEVASEQQRF